MITSHHQQFSTALSPTQETATFLYKMGLNVLPQPFGKKAGLPWKQLQYTRLHPNNLNSLFAGKCNLAILCGSSSGNFFVIDCESINALNTHMGHLRQRNIPLWIVQTARGGHIYLRCTDGEVANIESGILPDAEIRGSRCYVLAAGSIHPTGAAYEWYAREGDTVPIVSSKDINWLKDNNGRPVKLKLTHAQKRQFTPFSPLSRATQNYLSNGHTLAKGNRNQHLFNAACDLLGNGHSPFNIEKQLTPIAEASGLPHNEITNTLRSAASRERLPARPQHIFNRKPQTELWQHARTYAETHQWEGRSSTTDKLVFLALTERARTANENGIFRASIREISILARTSLNPVKKALKRLKNAQMIFYAGRDKTSSAGLWRFSNNLLKAGQKKSDSLSATPPWTSWSESLFFSTDAAERGALGYTGLRVYEVLAEAAEPQMPRALAAALRIPVHRVHYGLKKLAQYQLVERERTGWRALVVSSAELDERAARPAGKLGRSAARRERYAAERALYVGRIILQARLDMFREDFLERPRELQEFKTGGRELSVWRCPNCGQQHFADVPPDTCDFCQDFTTWKPLEAEDAEALADPLVQEALLLGAEIYVIENGRRRPLIFPLRL